MFNKKSFTCPVSAGKINENAARVAAFYTILVVILAVAFDLSWLAFLLAADFGFRAFGNRKYSLIRLLSQLTTNALRLKTIPVDAAPKKFAAGVGFVFSAAIATGSWLQLDYLTFATAAVLVFCALLEGVLAYCLGCVVYSFLLRLPYFAGTER